MFARLTVALSALALAGVAMAAPSTAAHPAGATECGTSGIWHMYVASGLPWADAAAAAKAEHGYLANIGSLEEDACINALIGGASPWVGGNDRKREGTWVWGKGPNRTFWKGGTAVGSTYQHFAGGEPNDSGGNEDCLQASAGGWNDLNCAAALGYVIEWNR